MDSRSEAKRLLKQGSHLLNAGENERALYYMRLAYGATSDYGDKTEAAYYLPRIRHGLALVHVKLGEFELAELNFKESLRLFEKSNHIGRARTLRDYGWFLVSRGKTVKGRNRIEGALAELRLVREHDQRWEREFATTQGFLARLDIENNPQAAIAELQRVDKVLKGCDKWIYELDNLEFLITCIPLVFSLEYRLRAFSLRERIRIIEDVSVLMNDIAVGRPIYGVGSLMVRTTRRRLPL